MNSSMVSQQFSDILFNDFWIMRSVKLLELTFPERRDAAQIASLPRLNRNLLFGLKLEWEARHRAKVVIVTIRIVWDAVLGFRQVLSIQKEALMLG